MAQFETTGGGFIDSGDKRIERKVIVATGGATPSAPAFSGGGVLSNVSITKEAAGTTRGVFEYTRGGEGGASYNQYGKRVELTGGTREVPIYFNPYFDSLTPPQIQEVKDAVANNTQGPFPTEAQTKLFGFLVRGTEYALAPAITARISEIESNLPSLSGIAKVANPSEVNAPANTFWILTAITATPLGGRYEVTREYTLNYSGWEDVSTLYGY
jgi:hypothetical protein